MNQIESFTYWKKPHQKWLHLSIIILQIIIIISIIQDYITVRDSEIFSQSAWEIYTMQQHFQFAINGLTIGLSIGSLLIGIFARSRKIACMFECILLLISSLVFGIAGFFIHVSAESTTMIIWAILLIATLFGSIYAFWLSRKL